MHDDHYQLISVATSYIYLWVKWILNYRVHRRYRRLIIQLVQRSVRLQVNHLCKRLPVIPLSLGEEFSHRWPHLEFRPHKSRRSRHQNALNLLHSRCERLQGCREQCHGLFQCHCQLSQHPLVDVDHNTDSQRHLRYSLRCADDFDWPNSDYYTLHLHLHRLELRDC